MLRALKVYFNENKFQVFLDPQLEIYQRLKEIVDEEQSQT